MTRIQEYDMATGHVETLTVVPDDEAATVAERLADHSTDHVIFTQPAES